jgi:hypothetical protein
MEKQNLSESLINSSTAKEQSLKISQQEKKLIETSELKHTTEIKLVKCNHVFKRIAVNKIECKICGFGLYDSIEKPFVLNK